MKTKCSVVKIGGGIINDETTLFEFLKVFSEIDSPKILVHGGGQIATQLSIDLGHEVHLINGRRVTTEEGLKVATMVYSGLINTSICAKLAELKCTAIGLSGVDANVIKSTKRASRPIDYGFAGDIQEVNGSMLNTFIQSDLCPVLCSITHDGKGQLLNTNADTIAAEVAISLSEFYDVDLFYCFDKPGVLRSASDNDSVIDQIDLLDYAVLQEENIINEGMLPKLHNCFHSLKNGVKNVRIGNVPSLSKENQGTVIKLTK
ncbi:MAG: acetylglutamate kinase [Crocinitomicaceae bacterium]|nr:acetylglutamate kinase [Flavobacteriales bacterium]NQZ37545.1 acetylglutamate kinase [Crocinitomicaceae bacterium]